MDVTARARRGSSNWWVVECETPNGPVYTQARRLDGVEAMVRDACELMGVHVDAVEVVPVGLPEVLADYREAARQAREWADRSGVLQRETVDALRGAGLGLRDVAALMGLSAQRIAQLTHK